MAAIRQSNGVIRANGKGLVYVTTTPYSQEEARNSLFAGAVTAEYENKGSHFVAFTLQLNVPLTPGTQPNELIHLGSMRPKR